MATTTRHHHPSRRPADLSRKRDLAADTDHGVAATSAGATGPPRLSGGAAKASRAPSWRIRTRAAPHCCTSMPSVRGRPPAASQARAEPSVGCPAKGNSYSVVKIRSR